MQKKTAAIDESLIRVQVIPPPDKVGQFGPAQSWEALSSRIDEIGGAIGKIAERLRRQLDVGLDEPASHGLKVRDVSLTFSLDLEAEVGVVVARAKTSAGFEVSLTWSRP